MGHQLLKKCIATRGGNGSFYHNPHRNWEKKKIFHYLKVVLIDDTLTQN
jgi:hypothetical protein